MNFSSPELSLIKAYLRAVGERLADSDRNETLAEIESHIHEAIAARVKSGERAGVVEAVLAEMDPPEYYETDSPVPDEAILNARGGPRSRSNWMLKLGLALCVLGGFFALIFPWYDIGRSIFIFSLLPAGLVLLVIGWLKRAYADGSNVVIGPLHQVGIGVGLLLVWVGFAFFLLPVVILGAVVLIRGCLPWAFKLPWRVTLPAGALLLGIACSAGAYVPVLFVPPPPVGPDDASGGLQGINHVCIGVPGLVLVLSGLARVVVNPIQGPKKNTQAPSAMPNMTLK